MKSFHSCLVLSVLLVAMTCMAKEPGGPRVVDLTAADSVKLKASYFSAGKPGPGVLLLHQCDHDRKIWDGLAQQLAAAGINVLTFDLRGFGESGGAPHSKDGPLEAPEEIKKWPRDIDAAFQYLKLQPGVNPDVMGVGGASCGVDNAINTAIRHPEIKSMVLLSGPAYLQGRQFLRQTTLPAFFAVADDDQYPFMVQVTEWLYMITANPSKRLLHYQTGHHGAEMFAVHPDLPVAIVDWYVTTLIKTPGRASVTKAEPALASEIRDWDSLEQPEGPAKLAQALFESRKRDPQAAFIPEPLLEQLAGEQFEAKNLQQALEIMKLAATAYPDVPNVYDDLAEIYLAEGQKDLARQNAKKALELLPKDTVDPQSVRDMIKASAEQKLKQLNSAQ
jgi:pimeloyl-ACP methyl ester carboxylesterase